MAAEDGGGASVLKLMATVATVSPGISSAFGFDSAAADGGQEGGASVLKLMADAATVLSGISSVFKPAASAAVLISNFCFLLAILLSLPMMH